MADERQDPQRAGEGPASNFNDRANQTTRHLLAALLLAGVGVAVVVIVAWALQPDSAPEGAGFVYTDPDSGQTGYRTLWDWLGLLIVPLAVAAGAAFISYMQKRTELDIARKAREEDREIARQARESEQQIAAQAREKDREIAQQARESEQQIASDRLRQATLEGYYDRMTELLLPHKLREADADAEARSIANARTVAVVRSLDSDRNRQLLAFLKASKLIERENPIIKLSGSDLSGAGLSGADLSEANLRGADLSGANLRWANLLGADLIGAVLSGADLSGAVLFGANLSRVALSEAVLSEAVLIGANLSRANLSEAVLIGANLSRANLIEANLIGTDLSGANLSGANLSEADLSGAVLSEADLGEADLSGANLLGAILNDAILDDAILSGADLVGADLRRTEGWTIAQLEQAETVAGSIMPDGTRLGFEATEYSEATEGPTFAEWKAQYLAGPE